MKRKNNKTSGFAAEATADVKALSKDIKELKNMLRNATYAKMESNTVTPGADWWSSANRQGIEDADAESPEVLLADVTKMVTCLDMLVENLGLLQTTYNNIQHIQRLFERKGVTQ